MSIKIGIAGTHSTGKTTLLRRIARELKENQYSIARVSDLATKADQLGFPILRKHNFASTLWIMSHGIASELEAELEADVVLVDRPVPDALGYLLAALKFGRRSLPKSEANYLWTMTSLHAATYAMLFKTQINPNQSINVDKVRDTDPRFRKLAAEGINQVFSVLKVPVRSLPVDPSRAEEFALKSIFSFLRNNSVKSGRKRRERT